MYGSGGTIKSSLFNGKGYKKFRLELSNCIAQQKQKFAVFCIYVDKFDSGASVRRSLQISIEAALKSAAVASYELIVDNSNHIAAVIESCSFTEASKLSRMVRSRLMLDAPDVRPNIAVIQVEGRDFDPQVLLSNLCTNLVNNVEAGSSKIEIKRL